MQSLIFLGFDFNTLVRYFPHLIDSSVSSLIFITVSSPCISHRYECTHFQFGKSSTHVFDCTESLFTLLKSCIHSHIIAHHSINNTLKNIIYEFAQSSSSELYFLHQLSGTDLYSVFNPFSSCFIPLPGPYLYPDSPVSDSIDRSLLQLNETYSGLFSKEKTPYTPPLIANHDTTIVIDISSLLHIDDYKLYLPQDFCIKTFISQIVKSSANIFYIFDPVFDNNQIDPSSILQQYELDPSFPLFDCVASIHHSSSSDVSLLSFNPSFFYKYLFSSVPVISPISSIFIDHPFFTYATTPSFIFDNKLPKISDFTVLPKNVSLSLLRDPFLRFSIPIKYFHDPTVLPFIDLVLLFSDFVVYPE